MSALPNPLPAPDRQSRLNAALLAAIEAREQGRNVEPMDADAQAHLDEYRADEEWVLAHLEPLRPLLGVGRLFGNYELFRIIGVGSQGVVYKARQVHVNKEVALKLIFPDNREQSLRELQMVANLEHENIVRVYHVGEHEGRFYFTMKLAHGTLADRLADFQLPRDADAKTLSDRQRKLARLVAEIARGLAYIHQQGVVHSDLKPNNVLLDERGSPLVSDLGLARRVADLEPEPAPSPPLDGATQSMAPISAEQKARQAVGDDIFALGASLHRLLTGRLPYENMTARDFLKSLATQIPAPRSRLNLTVGAGSDLDLICRKCLQRDYRDRYPSATALADDLERFIRGDWTSVRQPGWLERARRWIDRSIIASPDVPLRDDLHHWGMIDFWDATLNLACHGTIYFLIRADLAPGYLWLTMLTYFAVWWPMFLTYLMRRRPMARSEKDLIALWAWASAGGLVLLGVFCPPFGSSRAVDMLLFYPSWTVLNGLAYFFVGRNWWGRYHLVAVAHLVVAALMPLRLDLAPLVFAGLCIVSTTWQGFDYSQRSCKAKAELLLSDAADTFSRRTSP